MLSNAYFLAKIRFDTAENEPAKNFQHFAKKMAAGRTQPTAAAPRGLFGTLLAAPRSQALEALHGQRSRLEAEADGLELRFF